MNEQMIPRSKWLLLNGTAPSGEDELLLPATGGGLSLPWLAECRRRFFCFTVELLEDHALPMHLTAYDRESLDSGIPRFTLRFGLMPRIRTRVCIDLRWLDGHILFPGHVAGQLKFVCHGSRIGFDKIVQASLSSLPCFHDVRVRLSDLALSDERPAALPLPDRKLVDRYGQSTLVPPPNAIRSDEQLAAALRPAAEASVDEVDLPGRSRWGGWRNRQLTEPAGYFRAVRANGRWWLADPDGCAFFSSGPDCTAVRSDCRVDGLEPLLEWLPDRDDPQWQDSFREIRWALDETPRGPGVAFSFERANLMRVFGDEWPAAWVKIVRNELRRHGMNTLGNWSDPEFFDRIGLPFVTSLPRFPTTDAKIFRDFPDVFDPAFAADAERVAASLSSRAGNPAMIGYFLGNEPAWAFVNGLIIADEVLRNPADSWCRRELIAWLERRHVAIEKLNAVWNRSFESFSDLRGVVENASASSEGAREDLRAFSRILLERLIAIPSEACRRADPNHLNLGLRWAWISDPDVVTGWEHFDVFSINCYAVDPTEMIDRVRRLGVDRPVMIGEFHFGALDAGLPATGLEAVESQRERGVAYRRYCEAVAAHPNGVGCHWFQFYDQFALGRFDGENYNIGLFDLCSRPQTELMDAVRECGLVLEDVMSGTRPPFAETPRSIPMIAY